MPNICVFCGIPSQVTCCGYWKKYVCLHCYSVLSDALSEHVRGLRAELREDHQIVRPPR